MTKWEYKSIRASIDDDYRVSKVNQKEITEWKKGPRPPLTEYFNQLGLEGWELVGVEYGVYWFKRPITLE